MAALDAALPATPQLATARKVHAEAVLLLGGPRALLMQVAHPAIARGVAEHSNFQTARLQRTLRTLRSLLALIYGSAEQVEAAATAIGLAHRDVRGAGYDARDHGLQVWVLATIIDTALVMQERFVRPLAPPAAAAYYEDMKRIGCLLGLPASLLPDDLEALQRYVRVQSQTLAVSQEARTIARQIFRTWPPPWLAMWPVRQVTAGLLPPPLREQYGLGWGPRRRRLLDAASAGSRLLLPLVPFRLRKTPWFLMPES
jgi:uncharacterized protein (DUF2236 family)